MPHITIDYTANLDDSIEPQALANAVHQGALDCETFPVTGIRVFCRRHDAYAVAHGDRDEAFVQIFARIAPGRSLELKQHIANTLLAAAAKALETAYARRPLGLQLEVSEFDETHVARKTTLVA
jgi:5-carboxymethyl-2-hydroxymuconate isomerase